MRLATDLDDKMNAARDALLGLRRQVIRNTGFSEWEERLLQAVRHRSSRYGAMAHAATDAGLYRNITAMGLDEADLAAMMSDQPD